MVKYSFASTREWMVLYPEVRLLVPVDPSTRADHDTPAGLLTKSKGV